MADMTERPVRVLIVDSSELLRRGIRDVLARDRRYRFSIVGDVARPEEGAPAFRQLAPDVTFLALSDGGGVATGGGMRCLHEILSLDPAARVIALVDGNDLEHVLAAIQAGARGVLVREAPATALLEAAYDVVEGGAALDLRLAAVLFDHLASAGSAGPRNGEAILDAATLTALSPREREVLRALAQGNRNKEIAAALGVSVGTVKTHLRHIFRKLNVADRTSAVLLALHVRSEAA